MWPYITRTYSLNFIVHEQTAFIPPFHVPVYLKVDCGSRISEARLPGTRVAFTRFMGPDRTRRELMMY
jgi:hypothetical protein